MEEIRQYLEKKYGTEEVHEAGLRVYTSLNLEMQKAAQQAVRDGLAAYERRHGWKGNLLNVIANGDSLATYHHVDWDGTIAPDTYVHALVTEVDPQSATVKFGSYEGHLGPLEIKWTRYTSPQQFLTRGDLVYVKVVALNGRDSRVSLEQESGVQGALLALDNSTGDVKAMVGGRDFEQSKFNRAVQAERQVGSSFKPYIYTAAIDQGLTPDDTVLDAPVTFNTPSGPYTPHNYDGKFEGVITFRHALAESRNIPALKVTERVGGIKTVIEYARKFGITSPMPAYLPVALGAADITLAEQTAAFTTFPNDGVRVTPRYIRKVTDYDGRVLEENYPEVKDVVSARTARIMTSMLREVVLHGTGVRRQQAQTSAGRKDGNHQRFHGRVVRGLLAVADLWRMGWFRREENPRQQGNWRGCRVADLDGLYAGGAGGTRVGRFPRASADNAQRGRSEGGDARACRGRHRGPLMRRFFRYLVRVLVLFVVFMASALTAMRFAIHGRQTTIPKVVGMAPLQAERLLADHGLVLERGDRFFSSDVPEGRIMSQAPLPGVKVRRGWRVRVAESMGPQRVVIPNLVGGSERAAEINIRRRGLELGSIASATIPGGPTDQIVAQSPPANAVNVSAPKISVLLAAPRGAQLFCHAGPGRAQ